ncbi:MAG: archease [Acidobacteriaceae bacterium]
MFDFIVNREEIRETQQRTVQIESEGWEELLVVWLEELLYLFENDGFVLRRCTMRRLASTHLQAEISGETLDRFWHETKVQIKAVTYHLLRAESTDDGFLTQVIFDI